MMPAPILQTRLSFAPWHTPQGHRLPGTGPCATAEWLRVDEAYAAQMALRDRLLADRTARVARALPGTRSDLQALLDMVLDWAAGQGGFAVAPGAVTRPDGVSVPIDRDRPLATLGRLVQQDLCLMQRDGARHRLAAAVLCFPASWALEDKLGRPLVDIHAPVADYDAGVAARVQRLFDALRPDVVLARCNCLPYADPALHQPRRESDRRARPQGPAPFVRLERQTLRRLPVGDAVVFAIHTAVLARDTLSPADRAALDAHLG